MRATSYSYMQLPSTPNPVCVGGGADSHFYPKLGKWLTGLGSMYTAVTGVIIVLVAILKRDRD